MSTIASTYPTHATQHLTKQYKVKMLSPLKIIHKHIKIMLVTEHALKHMTPKQISAKSQMMTFLMLWLYSDNDILLTIFIAHTFMQNCKSININIKL